MARGRKKEELTLEEKLERALVPVEEQPYEVPENWCWVYQNVACQLGDGEKRNDEEHPYLEVKYLRGNKEADIKKAGKYIETGTKIILVDGENSGEVFEVFEDGYMGSTFKTLNISSGINEKYLLYFVDSKRDLLRNSKTGSAIPHLNKKLFFSLEFPLPPLQEQQRIVEKIESLFAKLDEAKEKVQEVIASIDDNVEALLYKAFTGQLTNEWRNSNIEIEKWEDTTLSEIVSGLKYGSSEKSDYEYNGTPILRIPNIGDGIVDFSDLKYMSEELKNSSHEVFEDDILIIRSNGSRDLVGKCALVPKLQERYAYASFLIRMKVTKKVLPEYLVRFINSSMARAQMFDKAKSSSGIHNINSKELGAIKICVPSIKEQKQILICIQEFVNKEKRVQEISEEMLGRIDRMKKSILAKAFRGELGTNNTNEESAIELFKTILVET